MPAKNRKQFQLSFAELVDRLSIDQIKMIMLPRLRKSMSREVAQIAHDLEIIMKAKKIKLSAALIGKVISLTQINLHIWNLKEKMQEDKKQYTKFLKRAHQLNGIRNRIKNSLLKEERNFSQANIRTNAEVDSLKGWEDYFSFGAK